MSVLFLVLPLAILASLFFVVSFAWSVKSGQLDDLTTPAMRMLSDDRKEDSKSCLSDTRREAP